MRDDYLEKATSKEVVEGVMGKPVKSKKAMDGKVVEEVTFRKVENGFIASIRYRDRKEKDKDGKECTAYEKPVDRICSKASDGADLLEECFG
jgi:hypothetical protein